MPSGERPTETPARPGLVLTITQMLQQPNLPTTFQSSPSTENTHAQVSHLTRIVASANTPQELTVRSIGTQSYQLNDLTNAKNENAFGRAINKISSTTWICFDMNPKISMIKSSEHVPKLTLTR